MKLPVINNRSLHKHEASLLIADEIHSLSEKQLKELKRFKHVIGLTGSLGADMEQKLAKAGLKVKFKYSFEEAIKDKIIADYQINIVSSTLDNSDKYIEGGTKNKKFYTTEQAQYNYLDKQFNRFKYLSWEDPKYHNVKMMFAQKRMNLLATCNTKFNLAKKVIDTIDRALIFTVKTDIADKLGEKAYHSKSKGNELSLFSKEKIDKLAVCNMVEMGITVPNLKTAVFHHLQSSEERAIQRVLRTMNLQEDKVAEIWIMSVLGTKDEEWTNKALQQFDDSKITYIDSRSL